MPGPFTWGEMASGLRDAVVEPMRRDIAVGNRAVKGLRDANPTIDNLAGIHPAVAAMQVANDVMVDGVDGGTVMNAAQAVPILKGLRGIAGKLPKQRAVQIGDTRWMVNMPATLKKNVALTGTQVLGQPVEAAAPEQPYIPESPYAR